MLHDAWIFSLFQNDECHNCKLFESDLAEILNKMSDGWFAISVKNFEYYVKFMQTLNRVWKI